MDLINFANNNIYSININIQDEDDETKEAVKTA
jgi:hypothetical protein